jgi:hypothetical protein
MFTKTVFFILFFFLRNYKKPKKVKQHKKRKRENTLFILSSSLLTGHVLKWFMVLISTQKRGDVVSNGVHMGIAVSATEHIAAGATKV